MILKKILTIITLSSATLALFDKIRLETTRTGDFKSNVDSPVHCTIKMDLLDSQNEQNFFHIDTITLEMIGEIGSIRTSKGHMEQMSYEAFQNTSIWLGFINNARADKIVPESIMELMAKIPIEANMMMLESKNVAVFDLPFLADSGTSNLKPIEAVLGGSMTKENIGRFEIVLNGGDQLMKRLHLKQVDPELIQKNKEEETDILLINYRRLV